MDDERLAFNRRRFLSCFSAAGLGSTLMPGALAAVAQDAETITIEMVSAAQKIAGLSFTREEQEAIVRRLNAERGYAAGFRVLRSAALGNATQPAIVFNPVPPGKALPSERRPMKRREPDVSMPATDEQLAFLPVTHLAKLVEKRQVKPSELTSLYLARLKRHDPKLHCVISLTEELARRQARRADEELAAGTYRGPLHGIPWGLKDLLFIGSNLALTNRTGHPALSVPSGFFQGSPTGLHLTGKLFGEPEILLLAHAFQARTDHHLKHPALVG